MTIEKNVSPDIFSGSIGCTIQDSEDIGSCLQTSTALQCNIPCNNPDGSDTLRITNRMKQLRFFYIGLAGSCVGRTPYRFFIVTRCRENLSSGENRAGWAESGVPWARPSSPKGWQIVTWVRGLGDFARVGWFLEKEKEESSGRR